jgi:hypothetical protein
MKDFGIKGENTLSPILKATGTICLYGLKS